MATQILIALVAGSVMGFLGSMPIAGPVAVLVLERGLIRRRREGLGVALGAAAAEAIYAFLAFWGLGAVLPIFYVVTLLFSGGAALRLEVECLEAELADLGPAWGTEACPDHFLDIQSPERTQQG